MQLPSPAGRWDPRNEAATRDILMQADAQNLKRGRPAEVGALTVTGDATVSGTLAVIGDTTLTGDLLWATDGGGDIGASAASRPNYCYLKERVVTRDGWQFGNGTVTGAATPDTTYGVRVRAVTNHPLTFATNDTNRWQVSAAGNLLAVADATYEIGGAGTGRPLNVRVSNAVVINENVIVRGTTATTATAGGTEATPATVKGYINVDIGGVAKKVAYYDT